MRIIFVDTAAWVALADIRDKYHNEAIELLKKLANTCQFITTNYVFDEVFTILLRNIGYNKTVLYKELLDEMVAMENLDLIWVDERFANDAWQAFCRFNVDKQWSFTDCVSYAVMRKHEILEAFTFDHHFRQMGFIVISSV